MIDPGQAAFENTADDHNVQFTCQACEALRSGTRHGFGEVECVDILGLAEILGAEEFLYADNLRADIGAGTDQRFRLGEVGVQIR